MQNSKTLIFHFSLYLRPPLVGTSTPSGWTASNPGPCHCMASAVATRLPGGYGLGSYMGTGNINL